MNIRVNNDYAITSDERNIILNTVHIAESGKKQGEEYYKAISYHGSLKAALVALRERGIKDSKAADLDELIVDVTELNERIAAL